MEHAENLRMSQDLHATLLSDQNTLGERKSKIKYVDELNSSLQLPLLVVLSVLRLRAHSFLVSLSTARKQDSIHASRIKLENGIFEILAD